jgi:ferredoxin
MPDSLTVTIPQILLLVLAGLWIAGLGGFTLVSLREHEPRAARIALLLAISGGLILALAAALPPAIQLAVLALCGLALLACFLAYLWPGKLVECAYETPRGQIDERDIMFARARLRRGSPEYAAYYAAHPEKRAIDDDIRALPGLMSPLSTLADLLLFSSPEASFALTGALRDTVDGPVATSVQAFSPATISRYLKHLARYYGALDVGITRLEPYHIYSHIGRGTGTYGEAIQLEHEWAIAFTVEMDREMIAANPRPPGLMESAKEYVESARIAVQLATAIRALGYAARAHIDGNYRVVAPLLGRDAGLGEIGRMGLLMTPRQGPRVRLGVVTTSLPLIADSRQPDPTVLDFCTACQKCAACCPSQAIPFGPRHEIDGVLRWQIDGESCYGYWCTVGTDCGRCMTVCPYSHPDNLYHNLVRWGIAHSYLFRRAALRLDDLFYGKKPAPGAFPAWTKIK